MDFAELLRGPEQLTSAKMLRPIAYFLATYGCAILGLQTSHLPTRWAFVVSAGLFTYQTLATVTDIANGPKMLDFGPLVIIGWFHALTLLLIERYELPKIQSGVQSFDISGGIRMLANARYVGTPREVAGLKRWPADENIWIQRWLPRRLRDNTEWTFVLNRLMTVFLIGLIEHTMPTLPIRSSDLHPKKMYLLRRLTDVSLREIWLRCLMVPYFVVKSWLELNFMYQGFAAVSVGLGWYRPDDWPRLFGDLGDLYSVRRLWSKFWHRLVYRPYGGVARIILSRIPRLDPYSPLYWTLLSFVIFAISGCVHGIVTLAMRWRCGWWADVHFYFLQFCGIILEEAVDYATRGGLSSRRWLGYIWLFFFLFWSIPKSFLPHWKWNCVPLG